MKKEEEVVEKSISKEKLKKKLRRESRDSSGPGPLVWDLRWVPWVARTEPLGSLK